MQKAFLVPEDPVVGGDSLCIETGCRPFWGGSTRLGGETTQFDHFRREESLGVPPSCFFWGDLELRQLLEEVSRFREVLGGAWLSISGTVVGRRCM